MITAADVPRVISVDDHVLEPPDVWVSRLPAAHRERGPRVVRERGRNLGDMGPWVPDADGDWADVWYFDGVTYALARTSAAAGLGQVTFEATIFDDVRPGCWNQADRLADMTANHVDASVCFPNGFPRFAGQRFSERDDKELALLCIQAYNDWMIDEWCGGDGAGRLIPLAILPLWDVRLAVQEVRRCNAKGCHAVTFPENPHPLGFPSMFSGEWDPLFAECEASETVINMHIGSSSRPPAKTPDVPWVVNSSLQHTNTESSLVEWIMSGTLGRFPELVVSYAEGQVGWMPYVMQRMDALWRSRGNSSFGTDLADPPTSYLRGRVYGCMFDDEVGLRNRDLIGMDTITFETDYPHSDTTYPHTAEVAATICGNAGLDADETYKLLRGNAIRAFGLGRWGITA